MEKHFDHGKRETEIYKEWEKNGVFKPERNIDPNADMYVMAMPPPNSNGELHLGHAFGYTIMDIIGRYQRVLGNKVLLIPGKDHAGIQTQVVFEKKLESVGIDSKLMDRKELFRKCYEFCLDRAAYMRNQEKRIGISADWDREMFTLDPNLSKIVNETFTKMWEDGLVYKGTRIVNWSIHSQTALSDVEIEHKEEKGNLYKFNYQIVGENSFLTVSTTRPETLVGDTALAVNPNDTRYKEFVGKSVLVPLQGRQIPIIADNRVDMKFGTGVVKVTPAHSFIDYEIGKTHKLEIMQVIGTDGKMTDLAGSKYAGLDINQCREQLIKDLEENNLLVGIEEIVHSVPIAERSKDVIEPLLSEQWFINVDKEENSLKKKALELLDSGNLNIYPDSLRKDIWQWLENLHDWNISRQIWWGHRMPVWYKDDQVYVGENTPEEEGWVQETDTFDTWFSSGQWAFSSLAANGLIDIDETNSSQFFPTTGMQMGKDILFFWACRMILLSAYRMNALPWKNIYFSGLVRDSSGKKMSKSKGNGIEPNAMIDKYGADALRISLVLGSTAGSDLKFNEKKIEGFSKFVNKLWNAAKLIQIKYDEQKTEITDFTPTKLELESSKWIIKELEHMRSSYTKSMERYDFSSAIKEVYNFSWSIFCDWYLEIMKIELEMANENRRKEIWWVTIETFNTLLLLIHPFLPFVTEEIFQNLLPITKNKMNMLAKVTLDKKSEINNISSENLFSRSKSVVEGIRSFKSLSNVPLNEIIKVAIPVEVSTHEIMLIEKLSKCKIVDIQLLDKDNSIIKVISDGIITIETSKKENYMNRLMKEKSRLEIEIGKCNSKLSSKGFMDHADPNVINEIQDQYVIVKQLLNDINRELNIR